MSTPEEAEAAITALSATDADAIAERTIDGRELKAQEARPREDKPRRPRY